MEVLILTNDPLLWGLKLGVFISLTIYTLSRFSPAWKSRVVSTYHATFITFVGIIYLLNDLLLSSERTSFYLRTQSRANLELSYSWHFSLGITCGYLIFDLFLVIFLLNQDKFTIVHHLLITVGLPWLRWEYSPHIALGLLSELSTPFLNKCWFLLHSDQRGEESSDPADRSQDPAFRRSSIRLFFTFFGRVVISFILVYTCLVNEEYLATTVCSTLLALNLYWFYLILRKAYSVEAKRRNDSKSDVKTKN